MPISIREHVPLRELTTFRTGGPAKFFCVVASEAELAEAVAFARRGNPMPYFILGGGSNILVGDGGFDGLVIKIEVKGISYEEKKENRNEVRVTAGAGENWDDFVAACVGRGLHGVENLSGIPGTVGAAPVQNIGAYGAEVSQTVGSVRVFDTQAEKFLELSNADCRFKYRDSIFKHEKNQEKAAGMAGDALRYIITSVIFSLKKDAPINAEYKDVQEYFSKNKMETKGAMATSIHDVRAAILSIRAAKLPDVRTVGTAGSFFKNPIVTNELFLKLKEKYPDLPSYPVDSVENNQKGNPVKVPLGWIIDHICGYKGAKKGNVGTYQNQALVIINVNNSATADEIKKFAAEITAMVKEKTSIDIEPEVQYVGN